MKEAASVRDTLPSAQRVVRAATLMNGVEEGASYS